MNIRIHAAFLAATVLFACPLAQSQGTGQVIVTILPKNGSELPPNVTQQDVQQVKANGKQAVVTSFVPLRGAQGNVELVILIDSSARTSLGRQMQDIERFVRSLPPNIKATIGYMDNGHAAFSTPLSTDREGTLKSLHLPVGGPGSNGSPYFCLSDLAHRWPSNDRAARREVVMITNGVDEYQRRLDPDDPYVQAAITDSIRAGMVVFSIYWTDAGRADLTQAANNAGQSLLVEMTEATGGKSFWQGMGNPVSFDPYFDELTRRLHNQYELGFTAPVGNKPELETFKLKLSVPGAEVDAPKQVFVVPQSAAAK